MSYLILQCNPLEIVVNLPMLALWHPTLWNSSEVRKFMTLINLIGNYLIRILGSKIKQHRFFIKYSDCFEGPNTHPPLLPLPFDTSESSIFKHDMDKSVVLWSETSCPYWKISSRNGFYQQFNPSLRLVCLDRTQNVFKLLLWVYFWMFKLHF